MGVEGGYRVENLNYPPYLLLFWLEKLTENDDNLYPPPPD